MAVRKSQRNPGVILTSYVPLEIAEQVWNVADENGWSVSQAICESLKLFFWEKGAE